MMNTFWREIQPCLTALCSSHQFDALPSTLMAVVHDTLVTLSGHICWKHHVSYDGSYFLILTIKQVWISTLNSQLINKWHASSTITDISRLRYILSATYELKDDNTWFWQRQKNKNNTAQRNKVLTSNFHYSLKKIQDKHKGAEIFSRWRTIKIEKHCKNTILIMYKYSQYLFKKKT